MGTQDKAKHLATCISWRVFPDFIVECVDENFGFSRYAERLGRSANSLTNCNALNKSQPILITFFSILKEKIETVNQLFSRFQFRFRNLYAAFRSAQWIKAKSSQYKISWAAVSNTELRSLSDARVFEFFDFITLDDGEMPIEELIHHKCSHKR
jgi:hypothetical protein